MDAYPEYAFLMREAFESSQDVDDFDLHSEDPESMAKWRVLLEVRAKADKAFVDYVMRHGVTILAESKRDGGN